MKTNIKTVALLFVLVFPFQQAFGDFHFWNISEAYSSADGTVQFIELFTNIAGQQNMTGHTVVATHANSIQSTFTFSTNLVGSTQNRRVLIATQRFESLTGLEADYIIPENFIPVGGGSLNFGEGTHIITFSKEQFPLNGVQSINASLSPQTASPTNFDGLSASLSVDAHSSFNPSTSVMNIPILDASGIGIGNVNFVVDLDKLLFVLGDFFLYGPGIAAGNTATEFLNGSALHVPGLIFQGVLYEFEMFLLNDNPFTFGNPNILNVIDPAP